MRANIRIRQWWTHERVQIFLCYPVVYFLFSLLLSLADDDNTFIFLPCHEVVGSTRANLFNLHKSTNSILEWKNVYITFLRLIFCLLVVCLNKYVHSDQTFRFNTTKSNVCCCTNNVICLMHSVVHMHLVSEKKKWSLQKLAREVCLFG